MKPAAAGGAAASERGTTLVEMLVVMTILSVLAVTAIPFAETAYQRRQELALRETLRQTRTAIDRFHRDWQEGRFAEDADGVSGNGFPVTLEILVAGMEVETEAGDIVRRRYLRRLPRNPFAGQEGGWRLVGYAQDSSQWDGIDVWDLRAETEREALDGTPIADW